MLYELDSLLFCVGVFYVDIVIVICCLVCIMSKERNVFFICKGMFDMKE